MVSRPTAVKMGNEDSEKILVVPLGIKPVCVTRILKGAE